MRLYIDKNNIESFIRSINSMPAEFEKCNLMLKKHFDMHLNLSKEDFAQSELCMSWANTLLDGRGKNVIHFDAPNKVFPQRPIDSTTFGGGFDEQQNCSVYLLEDNSVASTLEAKGNSLEVRFYDSYHDIEKINRVDYFVFEISNNYNQSGSFKPEWVLVGDTIDDVAYYKMSLPIEFSENEVYTIKLNFYVGNVLVGQVDTSYIKE